jgi:hypothetical protein
MPLILGSLSYKGGHMQRTLSQHAEQSVGFYKRLLPMCRVINYLCGSTMRKNKKREFSLEPLKTQGESALVTT